MLKFNLWYALKCWAFCLSTNFKSRGCMMKILRKSIPVLAFMLIAGGCATVDGMKKDLSSVVNGSAESGDKDVDNRSCAKNFTVTGSFFSGKKFRSYQDVEGISEQDAFKIVSQYIASNGWNITNTDSSLGVITATQRVVSGEGNTVPLNVVVKRQNANVVRVECIFSISGGLITSADGQMENFCEILASLPK